jgi:hypothetical protein
MKYFATFVLFLALLISPHVTEAQAPGPMEVLARQDLRLAAIAERMLAANDSLCRQHMPLTGLVMHSRDQYGERVAGNAFANGRIAVEAVVPGSAAAQAGVVAGDGIAAIGPVRTDTMVRDGEAPLRDTAFAALAGGTGPVALTLTSGGMERPLTIAAPQGCRALIEIRSSNSLNARSDGRVIQVNYGLAAQASDDELAVIFAHELGHLVLEHRRRLSEAGVKKGFFGEFGRNRRLNRQVEEEADRMSVHLLANAGYDPAIAPVFWRSKLGKRAGGGLFRSGTYPSPGGRARLIEAEIASYLGPARSPDHAAHLLRTRHSVRVIRPRAARALR